MEPHLNAPIKSTTRGSIVFLMLSFPMGLLYFLVTVIGISLGLGTLAIWIGLPILFITLLSIHGMAEIERHIVNSLLHMPMPYQPGRQREAGRGFLRQFGDILRDPYTWTGMVYMLLKLPLGIISFTLALTLSVVSAAVTLLPLAYLIQLLVNGILLKNGISNSGIVIPYFIEVHGSFDLLMFARSFIGVPVGLLLWFVTRYTLSGLALFSGELAKALLGPGEAAMQPEQDLYYASPLVMQGQEMPLD